MLPPSKMVTENSDNWTAEIKGKEMLSDNEVLLQTWQNIDTLNSYDLTAK